MKHIFGNAHVCCDAFPSKPNQTKPNLLQNYTHVHYIYVLAQKAAKYIPYCSQTWSCNGDTIKEEGLGSNFQPQQQKLPSKCQVIRYLTPVGFRSLIRIASHHPVNFEYLQEDSSTRSNHNTKKERQSREDRDPPTQSLDLLERDDSIIITCCNRRGGCGKTTNCAALAYALARRDYNVMVVDADPQCDISMFPRAPSLRNQRLAQRPEPRAFSSKGQSCTAGNEYHLIERSCKLFLGRAPSFQQLTTTKSTECDALGC